MEIFTYWVFGATIVTFFCYLSVIGFEKGSKYIKSTKLLDQIEDKYDNLRIARREMLQHYYWAQSLGEKEKEQSMEKEIFKIEDQLDELRQEFQDIKSGKKVPLKKI